MLEHSMHLLLCDRLSAMGNISQNDMHDGMRGRIQQATRQCAILFEKMNSGSASKMDCATP